uniref:Uncharacterized protein n=1 Tax=Oryza nivara TaxID=4536 RepID=A0A0E0G487_ORYNI
MRLSFLYYRRLAPVIKKNIVFQIYFFLLFYGTRKNTRALQWVKIILILLLLYGLAKVNLTV